MSQLTQVYLSGFIHTSKLPFLLSNNLFKVHFLLLGAATLGETLVRHRKKPRVYIGCMKSGPVLNQK